MNVLRLLNLLDRRLFDLSLVVAFAGGEYESRLAQDVKIHVLNTGNIDSDTLRMFRSIIPLRKLLKNEPIDIFCPVTDFPNIVGIIVNRLLSNPPFLIINVQNSIIYRKKSRNLINKFLFFLMCKFYPIADGIVTVSKGVEKELIDLIPHTKGLTRVIYNSGFDEDVEGLSKESIFEIPNSDRPILLACGRLTEQKGYPYLIEALRQVHQSFPVHLWILGTGEMQKYLEQKIELYGLSKYVKLLGFKKNPYQYMASADIFVFPSLWEGMPCALIEAMACNLPVISTNCPHGPSEIITNEVNGLLVPTKDSEALANAIIHLIQNPNFRSKLAAQGKVKSYDFSADKIAQAYSLYFREVHSKNEKASIIG